MKDSFFIKFSFKKLSSIFALLALLYIGSINSAEAVSIQIHITNGCGLEAWSTSEVGDTVYVYFGESNMGFPVTWSVASGNVTIIGVDIGSASPGDITSITVEGVTWTDSTMTETSPCIGYGGYSTGAGFGSVTVY